MRLLSRGTDVPEEQYTMRARVASSLSPFPPRVYSLAYRSRKTCPRKERQREEIREYGNLFLRLRHRRCGVLVDDRWRGRGRGAEQLGAGVTGDEGADEDGEDRDRRDDQ